MLGIFTVRLLTSFRGSQQSFLHTKESRVKNVPVYIADFSLISQGKNWR